jgi:hypothetical protein
VASITPRPQDLESFITWLRSQGLRWIDPEKITCTTEPLEALLPPSPKRPMRSFERGHKLIAFVHLWKLVHDYGDYRLTYDARDGRQ